MYKLQKNRVSTFRRLLGCTPHDWSWVFFQDCQNTFFLLLYYSACKKTYNNGLCMRWYRISCHSFWIQNGLWAIFGCWDISKTVLGVFKINQKLYFYQKHPKLFCLYLSNQISLKGHFVFKTNDKIPSITSNKQQCCSLFISWVIKQQKSCILNILKNTPNFGCMVRSAHPRLRLKPEI